MNKVHTGPVREGVEALEAAIPLMEGRRDFVGGAFARGWLAIGYAELGEFERAEAAAEDATRKAATGGDLIAQLDAQIAEAMVHSIKGDLDESGAARDAPASSVPARLARRHARWSAPGSSATSISDGGRFGEADEALRLGLDLASGIGEQYWGPTLQAWRKRERGHARRAARRPTAGGTRRWTRCVRSGNHLGEAGVLWKRAESRPRGGALG